MSTLRRYLSYFWRAKNKYLVHSPFVFRWINEVLEDDREFYAFSRVEAIRSGLLANSKLLTINDLGAGSQSLKSNQRAVNDIVRHSVSNPAKCRFLFRNALFFQPKNKLELGTCLGISTLYQYFADTRVPFYTLEGSPELLQIATQQFQRVRAAAIHPILGNFDDTLLPTLEKMGSVDYVYIDGNHRGDATVRYFEQLLPYCHPQTVLIFDDIYWSEDMAQAWQRIRQHPRVRLSIDVFSMGLVFFREEQQEIQHFTLIPTRYKPWQMGFFR